MSLLERVRAKVEKYGGKPGSSNNNFFIKETPSSKGTFLVGNDENDLKND